LAPVTIDGARETVIFNKEVQMNPRVEQLRSHGQSLWLDYIDRKLLTQGGLKRLVDEGICGVTTNPAIFHKAISQGTDYDAAIRDLLQENGDLDSAALYEELTVQDVQTAADLLMPVYQQSRGGDGFVSLEVSPQLADDTDATVAQARRLWRKVHRPNLMIKVPATLQGLPAIEALIAEGINVNVTLLFSVARYEEVIDAYVRGLARNPHPENVVSVASFFVSRIDTLIDAMLERNGTPQAQALRGKAAIASAQLAFQRFRARLSGRDYTEQLRRHARVQRLLWGSTSTKNPEYSPLLYVENLVGTDTVNTVPPDTLDVFLDHGTVRATLHADDNEAQGVLNQLAAVGVNLDEVTAKLEREGVNKFAQSYTAVLQALDARRAVVMKQFAVHP